MMDMRFGDMTCFRNKRSRVFKEGGGGPLAQLYLRGICVRINVCVLD